MRTFKLQTNWFEGCGQPRVRILIPLNKQNELIDVCIKKVPKSVFASLPSENNHDLDDILDKFVIRIKNTAYQEFGQVRRRVVETPQGNISVIVGPYQVLEREVLQELHQE